MASGHLGSQVAQDLDGHAHVLFNQPDERLIDFAPFIELEGRDSQAFLVDLSGIAGAGSRNAAADIRVMRDGDGKAYQLFLVEDWLNDEDVGQVHSAFVRVVQYESVTRVDLSPPALQDGGQTVGHRP